MKKRPKLKKLPKYPDGDVFRNQAGQEQPINIGNSGVYSDAQGNTYGVPSNQPNYGQYANAAIGALGAYGMSQNADNSVEENRAQGAKSAIDAGAGALTPWYGYAKMGANMGKQLTGNNKTTNEIFTPDHEHMINDLEQGNYTTLGLDSMGLGKFGRMALYATGNGNKHGFLNKAFGTVDQNGNQAKFPMGGVNYNNPNAEVEMQENSISPNGDFTQYNGPSHEMGGIPTYMEPGERIFSDRLKVPGTKKTFAEVNKKNNTTKEDKVIDNNKSTSLAKSTAKLIADIKRRKSDELFEAQEQIKADKFKSQLENDLYACGGMVKYKNGGIHIKPENRGKFTAAAKRAGMGVQEYASHVLAHKDNFSSTLVKRANFAKNAASWKHAYGGEQPPYETTGTYPPTGWGQYNTPIDYSGPVNLTGGPSDIAPIDDPLNDYDPFLNQQQKQLGRQMKKNLTYDRPNYYEAIEPAINTGLQNLGNIYDLGITKFGKKYDKEDSGQLTPERLNPNEAIRQANMEARTTRGRLKDLTAGNAGAYLSNLTRTQAANTMNKARIIQDFENANVGIGNQFMMHNQATRMQDKANEQMNKARSEDIARQAIRGIGTNTSAAYRDYKAGKMDARTAGMLSSMFRDYRLDMSNPNDWKIVFNKLQEGK